MLVLGKSSLLLPSVTVLRLATQLCSRGVTIRSLTAQSVSSTVSQEPSPDLQRMWLPDSRVTTCKESSCACNWSLLSTPRFSEKANIRQLPLLSFSSGNTSLVKLSPLLEVKLARFIGLWFLQKLRNDSLAVIAWRFFWSIVLEELAGFTTSSGET